MQEEIQIYNAFDRVYKCSNSGDNKKAPGEKLNEDLNSLVQRMRNDGYTEQEIQVVTSINAKELARATKVIFDVALQDTYNKEGKIVKRAITKTGNPKFYHVSGQPGCGKSAAINAIEESLESVPFASEMDVYRTKHPQITQIKEIIAKKYPDDIEKQGKEFVAFTSFFADLLELTVISYMISQGYSVIKETTGKNFKGICGMIDALKSQYPQMTASIACMAVAQEVSIDGTITRGETMNFLTNLFVEDLKKAGIDIKPVGRGNVPRAFSEDICSKIPGSMKQIAESGLIDGEFLIVKRGKEDSVVARITGDECKDNSDYIRATLADRITGEKAKEEERAHFDKKNLNMQYAEESLKKGNIEPSVELYLYPTKTWLKETDGALDFYRNASGLTDIEQIARWVVSQKMLPMLLDKTKKDIGLSNSSQFDTENAKANEALNDAGQRLGNVVIGMNNLEVVEGLSYASKK